MTLFKQHGSKEKKGGESFGLDWVRPTRESPKYNKEPTLVLDTASARPKFDQNFHVHLRSNSIGAQKVLAPVPVFFGVQPTHFEQIWKDLSPKVPGNNFDFS